MILWARNLDGSAIVTNMVLTGYFIVGSLLEERKLRIEFPETYREYQKKVSMLFPYQWLKLKLKFKSAIASPGKSESGRA